MSSNTLETFIQLRIHTFSSFAVEMPTTFLIVSPKYPISLSASKLFLALANNPLAFRLTFEINFVLPIFQLSWRDVLLMNDKVRSELLLQIVLINFDSSRLNMFCVLKINDAKKFLSRAGHAKQRDKKVVFFLHESHFLRQRKLSKAKDLLRQ